MSTNPPLIATKSFLTTATIAAGLALAVPAYADDPEWEPFSYAPYPLARISEDAERYPEAVPKTLKVSQHGEIEYLGGSVFGTHWFVDADGPVWHFVTAGDPKSEPVVMIHGWPDTWWANADVMALLADEYYVIAVDVLGYGQSDKGPETDVSYAGVAASLVTLLDTIGVDDFNLITHDRGTIVGEHLIAISGMSDRIAAYVRMQQSFDQPHGLPRPPHAEMATAQYQQQIQASEVYSGDYASVEFPEQFLRRLDWEFGFEGTAEASARTFQGTSFDIELAFRSEHVIQNMTMPVLLVQGARDPGQRIEEYMSSAELLPDARVAIVDTNHFIHAEAPEAVADLARELFKNGNRNRSEMLFSHPVQYQFPVRE